MSNYKNKNILLVVTGSIAAYKAAILVSSLSQAGAKVRCVLTRSAREFMGVATFEGLSGEPVGVDTFTAGRAMEHIHWAKWADLFLVYPASANFIGKLANGLANDLASTVCLARESHQSLFVAPAMNQAMWAQMSVAENVGKLKSQGVYFLGPASGKQACGDDGFGRALEPEEVIDKVRETFHEPLRGKKILVTYGGSREAIDSVRYIANTSSGRGGAAVVEGLAKLGADVHVLRGEGALRSEACETEETFIGFESLSAALKAKLQTEAFYGVVQMAAVSDYSVATVNGKALAEEGEKLSSTGEEVTIGLKKNPKLLNFIKTWSINPNIRLVGFKLTSGKGSGSAQVTQQIESSPVDFVVHNRLEEVTLTGHRFHVLNRQGEVMSSGETRAQLAQAIGQLFTQGEEKKSLGEVKKICGPHFLEVN